MYSLRRIAAGAIRRSRRLLGPHHRIRNLLPLARYDFWTTYAGILDGETLWVAVAGKVQAGETLALQNVESHAVTPMGTELEDHEEGQLLVSRFPLLSSPDPLPTGDKDRFNLVVLKGDVHGTRAPQRVELRSVAETGGPTRTPASRNHDWRFTLQSGPRRQARLTCIALDSIAIVHSISVSADTLHISFTVPGVGGEVHGLRAISEETAHASVRVSKDGDYYVADLPVGDLRVPHDVTARLVATSADGDLALHRHHNDLKDPKLAVPMPRLRVPGRSESIRLFFKPNGTLAAQRVGGSAEQ